MIDGVLLVEKKIDNFFDHPRVQHRLPYCIVACLVLAWIWTWSIGIIPTLSEVKDFPMNDEPYPPPFVYVLDCGSGKAALYQYQITGDESTPVVTEVSKTVAPLRLGDLLAAGDVTPLFEGLLDRVKTKDGQQAPLFVGATAGVRDGLAAGLISEDAVQDFENALVARYGEMTRLEVLTSAREAALELAAVRFAFADLAAMGTGRLVALSAGGMSCQIAWKDSSFVSLDLNLFAAQRVFDAVGEAQALDWWQRHVASETREALDTALGTPGRLLGQSGPPITVVGITMMASAAVQAGVGGERIGAEQLVMACDRLLDHARKRDTWWVEFVSAARSNGQNKYGLDDETFRKVIILSTLRLQGVVSAAFAPTVEFFLSRTNQQSSSVVPTNVEWPLGAVITTDWS